MEIIPPQQTLKAKAPSKAARTVKEDPTGPSQFGRRNLPAYERARLALRLKPVIAGRAKQNLVTHTESGYQGCQNSDKAVIDTKRELAAIAGVSHDTIAKVEKIESEANENVKAQLRSGGISRQKG